MWVWKWRDTPQKNTYIQNEFEFWKGQSTWNSFTRLCPMDISVVYIAWLKPEAHSIIENGVLIPKSRCRLLLLFCHFYQLILLAFKAWWPLKIFRLRFYPSSSSVRVVEDSNNIQKVIIIIKFKERITDLELTTTVFGMHCLDWRNTGRAVTHLSIAMRWYMRNCGEYPSHHAEDGQII